MAKPTLLPEWAINIVVDAISGKNNRTVPTQQERDDGFIPLNVKPKRQATNWLFNTIFKWLEFFDGVIDQDVRIASNPTFNLLTTTTTVAVGTDLSVAGDITGTINYTGAVTLQSTLGVTGKATLSNAINSIAGSDTGITGAELETLSGGTTSDAAPLHTHNTLPATIVAVTNKLTVGTDLTVANDLVPNRIITGFKRNSVLNNTVASNLDFTVRHLKARVGTLAPQASAIITTANDIPAGLWIGSIPYTLEARFAWKVLGAPKWSFINGIFYPNTSGPASRWVVGELREDGSVGVTNEGSSGTAASLSAAILLMESLYLLTEFRPALVFESIVSPDALFVTNFSSTATFTNVEVDLSIHFDT